MKELSIEEKAKRYDEIIKKANKMHSENCEACQICIEELIPELKESEDEKIREEIISNLKEMIEGITSEEIIPHSSKVLVGKMRKWVAWLEKQGENISLPKFIFDDVLALQCVMETTKKVQEDKELYEQLQSLHDRLHDAYWLEKQGGQKPVVNDNAKEMFIKALERVEEQNAKGYKLTDCDKNSWWEDFKNYTSCTIEQKPTGWSEKLIADVFEMVGLAKIVREQENDALTRALQSAMIELAKYSVVPQIRQEWSEEDEILLKLSLENLTELKDRFGEYYGRVGGCIDWLKSLRPQNTWKPSEAQMGALWSATEKYLESDDENVRKLRGEVLESLYEDLKKLMEK